MKRQRADAVVGFLVTAVVVIGGAFSWDAYQQQQAFEQMGSMMGTSMGAVHGTNPLWYVLGTVLAAAAIGGGYLLVRDDITSTDPGERVQTERPNVAGSESPDSSEGSTQSEGGINPESQPQARVLDLLPEDERRILKPILSSPGITQSQRPRAR